LERTGSGTALRVLLVSARESARAEVAGILEAWPGEVRLYWVSQPNLAVARGQDIVPQVILVDSELDGSDPVRLVRQLVALLPSSAVVALVEWDATARAAQAVLAGARAFLVKPLQPDELLATLRQILAAEAAPGGEDLVPGALGEVVVFCAPKGGTGRTSLAINTALGLLQAGEQSVALVDADYAAPAVDVMLNLYPERTIADLLPRLAQLDESLLQGVLATHASGLRVLMAPAPDALDAYTIGPMQIEQILGAMGRLYRWILIDLGLPMDESALAWVDASDLIVLSVLPEMAGLRNMRLLIDALLARGVDPERLWVVVNRSTIAGGISIADIEKRLHTDVRHTIPDDQPLATQAVNRGVPVIASHRRGALVRAYRGLAAALRRTLGVAEESGARKRLFSRRR